MTGRGLDLPLEVALDGPAGDLATNPRNLLTNRLRTIQLIPRGGRGLVTLLISTNVAIGALPVLFVVATSVVLGRVPAAVAGGVGSPAWSGLINAFVLAAAAFIGLQVLAPAAMSLGALLARRVDREVYDELMAASLASAGISALEDPEIQDELRIAGLKLEYAVMSPGSACSGMLSLVARYTQLAGFAIVVAATFSVLAGLALVAVVVLVRYGMRGGLSRYAAARRRLGAAERKWYYLREVAMTSAAGKEIRAFGLAGWLRRTYREVYLMWLAPLWAVRRRTLLWGFSVVAVWGLALAVVVLATIGAKSTGAATLTTFALGLQSAVGALLLTGPYPEADMPTAIGISGYDQVRRFAARVDSATRTGSVVSTMDVPDPVESIHFDRVGFAYPGQDRWIFQELDLTIPVGRTTAIVGVNGAGKTTLVKLLARLYEPTSGAVRVDGVDIRDYSVQRWRSKIAVIFQDFLRYEVSAADNIGFGSVDHLDDAGGIRAAAAGAGIEAALDGLPRGFDTPLAAHLHDGVDLSGGQWQRVALARALFALRHGAPVVVLDEPTASLDMRAEARFFDEFTELARGATTLLISHRFSTVRHADVIVVLDQGLVVERGSHDELMAHDGRYARMFRLQSELLTGGSRQNLT